MFSQKLALIVAVVAVSAVQGFAPVAQPRVASNTELNAFFFQKPTEKSPTLSLETEKKASPFSKFSFPGKAAPEEEAAPKKFSFGDKKNESKKTAVKKVVAKKVVKKVVAKKAPAVKKAVAKKVVKKVVAKKAPAVKKAVAKKVVKKVVAKKSFPKNTFAVKAPEKKNKLTIYERQCHIN